MKWERVRLGNIVELSNGINFNKNAYKTGIRYIGVSDFSDHIIPIYDELGQVDVSVVRSNDYLQDGDIVFVRSNGNKDLVGRCMLVKSPPFPITFSGFCIRARIIDRKKYDPVYLTYHFKDTVFKKSINGSAVGANIQNLSQGRLSSYEFIIPRIETQHKIASILSSYDSLIENNQRQIKLLEEAAQRLYREWFVDLRFPGHESVRIVDGVPEGWKICTIEDIADYLNGYPFKPYDWGKQGKPIIKIKELNEGITENTPRNSGEAIPEKYYIKAGDIVFSWSATLTAKIWDDEDGLLNQHLFKVTPAQNVSREFVLQAILYALKEFANLTTGSTMKHIQRGKLQQVDLLMPSDDIMVLYTSKGDIIRDQILLLSKQVKLLTEARDRLLPKLMSGEINI